MVDADIIGRVEGGRGPRVLAVIGGDDAERLGADFVADIGVAGMARAGGEPTDGE